MKFNPFSPKKNLYNIAISLLLLLLVAGGGIFAVNSYRTGGFGRKSDTIVISHLRTCNLENPIGIDEETPFFGWRMEGEGRGLSQSAYRIMVAASEEKLAGGDYIWDSGKVEVSESVGILYGGEGLEAKSRYYWQVSVWNQNGEVCTSTEEAFFETGLMGEGMQGAKWISAPKNDKTARYAESDNNEKPAQCQETGHNEEPTRYTEPDNNEEPARYTEPDNNEEPARYQETGYNEKMTQQSENEYYYTIKYDIYVTNAEASFIFGADGGRYGDMYLCRISNRIGDGEEDGAAFGLQRMSGGGFAEFGNGEKSKENAKEVQDNAGEKDDIDEQGKDNAKEREDDLEGKDNAKEREDDLEGNDNAGRLLDVDEEIDITFCRGEDASLFSVELQIEKNHLSVIINGNKIGDYAIEAVPVGAIGYYKSRGVSYAYLDNLLAVNCDGDVIYEEDFEGDENIFSPYYVHVEDGRLRIGSGLVLTRYHDEPAPYFYREFALEDKKIESARIYMTALGSFSLICNGQRVSEDYFAPGKFVYNQELTYVSYDVTRLLESGKSNALGIILLHGWYDRAVGYPEIWNPWGDTNAVLGMLEVSYQDGSTETITTDENFLCSTETPIREDDIYQGEFYDAALEEEGFGEAGFSHEDWQPAMENAVDSRYCRLPLRGKENEPIRCVEELAPVSVSEPCENVFVYDFGQNFAGTCRVKTKGEKGRLVTFRYGEILNAEDMDNCDDVAGTVWTENLLTAQATDYYVLKGAAGGESFEPKFTYHGFRYLQIMGLDEALPLEDVKGIVLSSDLEASGGFECSNELLNRYYENTVWSQRSNFMDNPTDCPQRDERHGWAGDAQIYSLTASYHANTYNFYRKYLNELRLLQTEDGAFPDMAPRNFGIEWNGSGGSAGNNCWGDAAVVITWNLYTQYGNPAVLEENYEALRRWMGYLIETSDNYIRNQGGYGDHLSSESTPAEVSDTAWCARSADLMFRIAAALSRKEEAKYYRQIYEKYKAAWQSAYIGDDGVTSCDTQTSYALGLAFDLFPENLKEKAIERLKLLAQYSGCHINTGYSGIGYLLPVLSEHGLDEIAYNFLLQEEYPSLLYPVKNGATTTYEALSAYTQNEDGSCHYSGSLNHYAYGAPASWLYTNVLGIASDENDPGFHHIILKPEVNAALTYAKGSYESVYGKIEMEWEKAEEGYVFNIVIPANTTAKLTLPELDEGRSYLESGMAIEDAEGVRFIDGEGAKFSLESGRYRFEAGEGDFGK